MTGPTNLDESTSIPLEQRDKVRAEVLARVPKSYSPWLHLAFPSICGIAFVVTSLWLVRDLQLWQGLMVIPFFVLLNAGEWRVHRDLLHKRTPGFTILYDRHTPEHHVVYVTDDMAVRSRREWRLVLIPPFGIWAALFSALPVPIAFALLGQWNLGMLFIATAMAYVVTYEWLHLSYHLAPDSFIGRLKLIQILRRHHATHHNPQLMQKWNFNVSIPLWDFIRGTIYKDKRAAKASAPNQQSSARPA
jgi:hypothetical protein